MSFLEKLPPSLRTPGEFEPNWAYFVAKRDESGASWAVQYCRPEHVSILNATATSLKLMRRNQMRSGFSKLEEAREALPDVERNAPDVVHVLGRFYYGALAYYHYAEENFAAAEEAFDCAHEEVRRAIERKRFLVPFSSNCFDFSIQRIRIVRNQRRWEEMWKRVEIARQTAMGEHPYCVLTDGTEINLASIQAFYRSFEPFSQDEERSLRTVFDEEARARDFRFALAEIYALPGFVIPYLPTSGAL